MLCVVRRRRWNPALQRWIRQAAQRRGPDPKQSMVLRNFPMGITSAFRTNGMGTSNPVSKPNVAQVESPLTAATHMRVVIASAG